MEYGDDRIADAAGAPLAVRAALMFHVARDKRSRRRYEAPAAS